jgi:4-amino-4-deoxy-L-arabinose transferase-like glycosyltransferase
MDTYAARSAGRASWLSVALGAAWVGFVLDRAWPARHHDVFASDSAIDSAFFALAGDLVRRGGTPYLSFWDHKPPLVFFIDAFGLWVSGGEVWGIWLVSFAALVLSLVLAHLALRHAFGAAAAVLGVCVIAFNVSWIRASNLTEEYALPLQCATMLLVTRWAAIQQASPATPTRQLHQGLVLGILAGLAFALKANLIAAAIAAGITVAVVLVFERRFVEFARFAGGVVLGVALVWGAIVIYMIARGAFAAFVDQVFRYNFLYAGASWGQRLRAALGGVTAVARYGTFILPFAGWVVAGVLTFRTFARLDSRRDPARALRLFGLVWLPLEVLFSSISGRGYMHYFVALLPVLAYLSALLASELSARLGTSRRTGRVEMRAEVVVLAFAACVASLSAANTLFELRDNGASSAERRRLQVDAAVDFVRANSTPREALFVWGHASDVYLLSDRRPATRHVYPFALLTPRYADSALVAEFLEELRATSPPLILDATHGPTPSDSLVPPLGAWTPDWRYPVDRGPRVVWWSMTPALRDLYEFVATRYVVTDSVGPQHWHVYRRRDLVDATPPHEHAVAQRP